MGGFIVVVVLVFCVCSCIFNTPFRRLHMFVLGRSVLLLEHTVLFILWTRGGDAYKVMKFMTIVLFDVSGLLSGKARYLCIGWKLDNV